MKADSSADQTQISAHISRSTKDRIERYVEAHGVRKGFLLEAALLHHLQALEELPQDVIIPPRLVVTEACARRILDRVERPRPPTEAMRQLFADEPE